MKIARFLIWKMYHGPARVVQFALDAVKLAIDCCYLCSDEGLVDDMEWSLREAFAYDLQPTHLSNQGQKDILVYNQTELVNLTAELFCLLSEKSMESRKRILKVIISILGHS